jgi:hypothetical protein
MILAALLGGSTFAEAARIVGVSAAVRGKRRGRYVRVELVRDAGDRSSCLSAAPDAAVSTNVVSPLPRFIYPALTP